MEGFAGFIQCQHLTVLDVSLKAARKFPDHFLRRRLANVTSEATEFINDLIYVKDIVNRLIKQKWVFE